MSLKSSIQWTDSTHNFWRGCTKVSLGCANCYAEKLVTTRLGGQWGKGAPRTRSANFNAPVAWNKTPLVCDHCGTFQRGALTKDEGCLNTGCPSNLSELVSGSYHRRRVFSLSLGDWLDREVPIEWLRDMLHVIWQCNDLVWQLVTKRPELFFERLWAVLNAGVPQAMHEWLYFWVDGGLAPKNVWVIASTENQEQLDKRGPDLLKIPAALHGLSCEPLLGPLNLNLEGVNRNIRWVIGGGESGPNARPCHINWLRDIVKQCQAAGVPPFVKQLGAAACQDISAWYPEADIHDPESDPADIAAHEHFRHNAPLNLANKKGGDWSEWPESLAALRVREFPPV